MEHGPESHDEDGSTEGPGSAEPTVATGVMSERVRIIGAATAADITSELPVVPSDRNQVTPDPVDVDHIDSEPVDAEPSTALPHWTEPPTGQVPAVLARDDEAAADTAVAPPTWREDDADWTADEEMFDASMLGDDEAALGALDESAEADEDLRPWEFDLDDLEEDFTTDNTGEDLSVGEGHDGSASSRSDSVGLKSSNNADGRTGSTDDTAPTDSLAPMAGEGVDEEAEGARDDQDDPAADLLATSTSARPTGTRRSGRLRRGRLGAGSTSLAESDTDTVHGDADTPDVGRTLGGGGGGDGGVGGGGNEAKESSEAMYDEPVGRLSRWSRKGSDRPLRASSNYVPDSTGGGPPLLDPVPSSPEGARATEPVGSTGLRIGTGVAVAVIALVAFKLGTVPSLILCLIVVTCAAGEGFAVLRKAGYHPATLLGLVGTISLMVGAYAKGVEALPLILVLIASFTLLWYLFGVERGSPVAGTAATLFIIGWVATFGSYAGLLLSPSTFPDRHGIAFLLGAIVATVANDVGALVVGRWIGTHPLYPSVSPNKTWEGLAGGALTTILVSTVVVGAIHPWSPSNAALLGVVVAVVAPLGDLCESMLKRDLRMKDMGTLLPGHGGVLDRVDALLFVLPATYYLVRALNIG